MIEKYGTRDIVQFGDMVQHENVRILNRVYERFTEEVVHMLEEEFQKYVEEVSNDLNISEVDAIIHIIKESGGSITCTKNCDDCGFKDEDNNCLLPEECFI